MGKVSITPGKLYARLSAEFVRLRPPRCDSCHMPMVYVIEPRLGSGANWLVDDPTPGCEECRDVLDGIVRRFSLLYDIFDPTCTPVRGKRLRTWSPPSAR
jgi:hypothetical protein